MAGRIRAFLRRFTFWKRKEKPKTPLTPNIVQSQNEPPAAKPSSAVNREPRYAMPDRYNYEAEKKVKAMSESEVLRKAKALENKGILTPEEIMIQWRARQIKKQ